MVSAETFLIVCLCIAVVTVLVGLALCWCTVNKAKRQERREQQMMNMWQLQQAQAQFQQPMHGLVPSAPATRYALPGQGGDTFHSGAVPGAAVGLIVPPFLSAGGDEDAKAAAPPTVAAVAWRTPATLHQDQDTGLGGVPLSPAMLPQPPTTMAQYAYGRPQEADQPPVSIDNKAHDLALSPPGRQDAACVPDGARRSPQAHGGAHSGGAAATAKNAVVRGSEALGAGRTAGLGTRATKHDMVVDGGVSGQVDLVTETDTSGASRAVPVVRPPSTPSPPVSPNVQHRAVSPSANPSDMGY